MLSFGFRIFCWYRGFCHRTGSDLLLFLFNFFLKADNEDRYMHLDSTSNALSNGTVVERFIPIVYYPRGKLLYSKISYVVDKILYSSIPPSKCPYLV